MKKKLPKIFIGLIFIIGLGIMLYPIISNLYIEHHQGNIIDEYNKTVESMPDDTLEKEREKAEGYNKMLTGNMVITDPFDPEAQKKLEENSDYYNILNIGNDNIIGYIKIPKINVSLPIYHGTSEDVLKRGVGHLQNTSFPIGGEGTHAVLSGHTGLSSAKLFTDLDKLEEGELFFIEVLGEKLAYKIDQIKIVEPSETSDLVIKSGEDYVTLVNSHRLLVRGTRVPYTEDVEKEAKNEENSKVKSTWRDEYFKALAVGLGGLSILAVIFIIIVLIKKKGRRKK